MQEKLGESVVQPKRLMLMAFFCCLLAACGARTPIVFPESALPIAKKQIPDALSEALILEYGFDALSARVRLLRAAEESIDLQYYIWHPDVAGKIMLHEVLHAADRGVHVRIIVDGMGAKDSLHYMRRLDVHERIDVRVFNTLGAGVARAKNAFRIDAIQRRMHNKLIVVDERFALTGGRNIGNKYFWADEYMAFLDMDILAYGAVVPAAKKSFDLYWESQRVKPIDTIYRRLSDRYLTKVRKELSQIKATPKIAERMNAALSYDALTHIREHSVGPYRGEIQFYADHPDKIDPDIQGEQRSALLLQSKLNTLLQEHGQVKRIDIANAYFIPDNDSIAQLAEFIKNGAEVRILTNSLMSTDVPMAHSAYAPLRRQLLDLGAELWELRAYVVKNIGKHVTSDEVLGLHTKMLLLDDDISLIGSANLDPRSKDLNTELLMIIKNKDCNAMIKQSMDRMCQHKFSFEILPRPNSPMGIIWRWLADGEIKEATREPHRNLWRGFLQNVYRVIIPTSVL